MFDDFRIEVVEVIDVDDHVKPPLPSRSTSKDNGVASKPATQILADTAAALKRVRSVRMQGTVAIGGKRTAVRIELGQPKKIRVALKEKDTTATLIVIGDSVYIKANAAFWKQQGVGPAATNLADQWIEVPGSSADLRDLTKDISLATLSRCLVRHHGTLSVAGKERFNERPAFMLVDKGYRPGTAPGKLFVSTTGEPLPLRATTTGRQTPGGKTRSRV